MEGACEKRWLPNQQEARRGPGMLLEGLSDWLSLPPCVLLD